VGRAGAVKGFVAGGAGRRWIWWGRRGVVEEAEANFHLSRPWVGIYLGVSVFWGSKRWARWHFDHESCVPRRSNYRRRSYRDRKKCLYLQAQYQGTHQMWDPLLVGLWLPQYPILTRAGCRKRVAKFGWRAGTGTVIEIRIGIGIGIRGTYLYESMDAGRRTLFVHSFFCRYNTKLTR
jgi:hypothetical protein